MVLLRYTAGIKTKTVPGDSGTVVLFLLFAVHQITNDVLSCDNSHQDALVVNDRDKVLIQDLFRQVFDWRIDLDTGIEVRTDDFLQGYFLQIVDGVFLVVQYMP